MALLVLIMIGASMGWLSSIVARTERAGEILRQIGIGTIASLLTGLAANQGSILAGLTMLGLGAALLACLAALAIYHLVVRDRLGA